MDHYNIENIRILTIEIKNILENIRIIGINTHLNGIMNVMK